MSAPPRRLAPLPDAVTALLDRLVRETGATVRLWDTTAGGRLRLYGPAGAGAGAALCRPIELGRQRTLELVAQGGRIRDDDVDLAAQAIAGLLRYEREVELAARELAERYEEINLLYSISETLGSVVSLAAAASRILGEVVELLGARRASLWVHHAEDDTLHLVAAVGDDGITAPIPVDDPSSITASVFRDRQPLSLERGDRHPGGKRLEPGRRGGEAFLSVPIQFTPLEGASRTVGVITLIGRTSDVRYTAGDVRLLSAIASQVGAAIETHRLMEENVRQERFTREMELAHDLQMKLLPDASQFHGLGQVVARCVPAESVGGDFYHLFRLPGERLGVMIGDVSSHGFSAAMIMALTMSAVAIYAPEAGPPATVLDHLHDALIGELQSTEMYMTLFYGVLDPAAGRLTYANAGHPHAFRVPVTGAPERLGATSPPLGVLPEPGYREAACEWVRGRDLLCLFTDGLSDACAPDGGPAGERALVGDVARLRDRPPMEILNAVFRRAGSTTTRRGTPPDDRTAVLIRI